MNNIFNANINNVNKLVFFSDVHGDIMGLIINLRDCAKVIKKVDKIMFNQDKMDMDLERQLNVNLNDLFINKETKEKLNYLNPAEHKYFYEDNSNILEYNDNLNYEWIGGDTHIVIVGDIMDNVRREGDTFRMDGEHIHEEIKVFRFLNALDDMAKKNGGRIIKLFGNHDLVGVVEPMQYFDYHSKFGDLEENMYHGIKRYIFFTTKEGKDLLKYNGMGLILKINDYICVHGSFTGFRKFLSDKNFNSLQKVNDICLKHIFNNEKIDSKYMEFILGDTGLLIDRTYGDVDLISKKYSKDQTSNLENFNKNFCENIVIKNLKEVCDSKDNSCNNNVKIIIGHCPQFKNYNSDYKLQGFLHDSSDGEIQDLKPVFKPVSYKDYHYGISHSCSQPTENDNKIDSRLYRVDIGVSRAFDNDVYKKMTGEQLYHILKSRSPQVLIIDSRVKPNKARVRRSTIKNALIHQPRSWLQNTELETEILKLESINKNQAGGRK